MRVDAVGGAAPLGYTPATPTRRTTHVPSDPQDFSVPADRPHFAVWPKRLPHALVVPETTLWFNLETTTARFPRKAAYVFIGRELTYTELHRQAEAVAGWLQAEGVARGDRVGVFLQNCPQFPIAFYGTLRAGAAVVPINPMNRAAEVRHCLEDAGVKVVVCSADLAASVAEAVAEMPAGARPVRVLVTRYADAMPEPADVPAADAPSPAIDAWLRADPPLPSGFVRWADAIGAGLAPRAYEGDPDDLALLPYTSGTTGMPKGCIHTHRTLMANTVAGLWGYGTAESLSLGVVPMFHITGMLYGVLGSVAAGATVVVLPRWDRETAGRILSARRITHWVCIPTMIIDLFGSPNYKSFDLSSLRSLSGGGAAMPHAVAERVKSEFGIDFAEGYGLTETAAPSHANPPERAKLQCLGIPIFGVDSRVVDPATLQELPPGESGEIITRGPMVFKGYWNHPEATAAAFVQFEGRSFFRTGDLGRMDEEGYFFMTDRLKRMINASGYKVWPAEVEMLLYKHPAVQEACIIGAKDAYRGETVKAVVVLRAEAKGKTTGEDITAWARDHMAAYKVPKLVEFVDALPKSGSGKVMWRLLQEQEAAGPQ